jgi:hypothetical protein
MLIPQVELFVYQRLNGVGFPWHDAINRGEARSPAIAAAGFRRESWR